MIQPPPAIVALIDQRMAMIEDKLGNLPANPVNMIITPLTEPRDGATTEEYERWDRTCDACRTYCGPMTPFWTGVAVRSMRNGQSVTLMYGVCKDCKAKAEQ